MLYFSFSWTLIIIIIFLGCNLSFLKVMVSAKEEKEASIPPAVDGLLRVHKRIVDGLDNDSGHAPSVGGLVSTKLLVPTSRTGTLIGKQGAVVKSIQEASNVIISVHAPGDFPLCFIVLLANNR